MAQINEVKNKDWSVSIREQGDLVEGRLDVDQCIRLILMTEKGSDPLRPEFGTNLILYIDKPINVVSPKIVQEVYDAISVWEKRVTIVSITPLNQNERLIIRIVWKLNNSEAQNTTEVNI